MTTAMIGLGNIGSTLARELAAGGERVELFAPSSEKVVQLASEIGPLATPAASNREAVAAADTVVFAVWLSIMKGVINEVADLLKGKVVIDPSNPVTVGPDGKVTRTLPDGQSAGQLVFSWLPRGIKFAKAFGTVSAPSLASGSHRRPTLAVLFYAADDDEAAGRVEGLIRAAGFDPVRVGGVSAAARIEVGGDLHDFGGLNGRLVDRQEALKLLKQGHLSPR
jgi:8-hydroxy-5-deazaflavin:NADPH oxidoreductase